MTRPEPMRTPIEVPHEIELVCTGNRKVVHREMPLRRFIKRGDGEWCERQKVATIDDVAKDSEGETRVTEDIPISDIASEGAYPLPTCWRCGRNTRIPAGKLGPILDIYAGVHRDRLVLSDLPF